MRRWRGSQGLSQLAVAEAIGVTQPTVSALESGDSIASLRVAVAIEELTRGVVGVQHWIAETEKR